MSGRPVERSKAGRCSYWPENATGLTLEVVLHQPADQSEEDESEEDDVATGLSATATAEGYRENVILSWVQVVTEALGVRRKSAVQQGGGSSGG